MQGLLRIKNDLFGIADRIKQIEDSYVVYYNRIKRRFEVHSKRGFELVLPFSSLDARTYNHLYATHIKNVSKALAEIESHNEKLERTQQNHLAELTSYKTKNLVSFLDGGGSELPSFEEI